MIILAMACPKVDFIVGPAILLYFATLITELTSSVPVGLEQVGLCVSDWLFLLYAAIRVF